MSGLQDRGTGSDRQDEVNTLAEQLLRKENSKTICSQGADLMLVQQPCALFHKHSFALPFSFRDSLLTSAAGTGLQRGREPALPSPHSFGPGGPLQKRLDRSGYSPIP